MIEIFKVKQCTCKSVSYCNNNYVIVNNRTVMCVSQHSGLKF
jgi:hypothetical protein